jgi:ribosomal protein L37AE/L43A
MNIPEGFVLVPKSMLLDKEVIGAINFHCGDGADGQFGEYSDGHLWVGTVTDDDGKGVHGLHLATSEYPEEGSTTLVEFPAVIVDQSAAHLTIPGALEWDGDNGTHGADGESRAHGESRVPVRDAIAEALGDAYDCTRVWSAWQVGTMDQNDFSLIVEDDSRLDELAEAAIQAYDNSEVTRLRAQLASTEQSRRSFFDLSKDLEKRLAEFQRVLSGMLFAYDDGVGRDWSAPLLDHARTLCPAVEFVPASTKCESCGDWGHIETEDSAHDCPECGPSVVERAVEAGVMNAPKPYVAMTEAEVDEFLSSFGGGSGNKAKRRIAAIEAAKTESAPCWSCSKPVTMEDRAAADGYCPHCVAELELEGWPMAKPAKPKTCIECDQPHCPGVCVERGDQDYDRDQAAKGGDQ